VVRQIFDMYIEGLGFGKIASKLGEEGILNPSKYNRYGRYSDTWGWTTIRRIITNPVYLGHSVQQKYCRKSFKSKKVSKTNECEWIKVENTHEAIVDEYVYNLANHILYKKNKNNKSSCGGSMPHLFTSFLICHDCKSSLYYKKDKYGRGVYRCGRYVKYGTKACTSHYTREDELIDIINNELKSIIDSKIDIGLFLDSLKTEVMLYKRKALLEIKSIDDRIENYNKKKEDFFLYRLDDTLSYEEYKKALDRINTMLFNLYEYKNRLIEKTELIDKWEGNSSQDIDISCLIDIHSRGRSILEQLIDSIEIWENGDLEIFYKFNSK